MIRKLKIKLLTLMIWLCDKALANPEGADDNNDLNDMIANRNEFKRKLRELEE